MKRASTGRGSNGQRLVLKPRNNDFTPNNRQSAGQSTRRSYISKLGDSGNKRVNNRMMRGSTEGPSRPPLVNSRFTPTRNTAAAWAPQSSSRISSETGRGSSMGMSCRKDSRPISDPTFKSQCIDKVLEFLRNNGYEHPFQRRTLLTPSAKDFINIFSFVYRHLDPFYTLPSRFEEEIPKLLKKLHYPVQITKSSFVTVGSPHTWPSVLAMLAFMVDVVNALIMMSHDSFTMSCDFEMNKKLWTYIKLFKAESEEEYDAGMEEYYHDMMMEEGVRPQDMIEIQDELEKVEHELESLTNTADELREVQQICEQSKIDAEKLSAYCNELRNVIEKQSMGQKNMEQELEELKSEEQKLCEEVSSLEKLQAQQGLSRTDLTRFKNHAQDVGQEIEQQEQQGKDLQNQIWSMELEVSKVQPTLRNSIGQFESLIHKLGMGEQCTDLLGNYEDLSHDHGQLMNQFLAEKKKVKMNIIQTQHRVWEKEQKLSNLKEMLKEVQLEGKKVEAKLRRKEEDFEVTREELAREERQMMDENERLHQQAMEARKAKKPLYQMQRMLEDKKRELEDHKKKEHDCLVKGSQFLMKVTHGALQHIENQESITSDYKQYVFRKCEGLEKVMSLSSK